MKKNVKKQLLCVLLDGEKRYTNPMEILEKPDKTIYVNLRKLKEQGLVKKLDRGLYGLTEDGERELEPVCEREIEGYDLSEEEKKRVRKRVERYEEKYGANNLPVEGSVGEVGDFMDWARKFYRSYPDKLREITDEKIKSNRERKYEILLKRGEISSDGKVTPGEGDVRILAECIRLSETPIHGVWGVSILSNDSDFLRFSSEIEREFGIKVHDI